ncbi:MAG: polyribonucleotide nucleotidyltransferase [Patescibacteria group bacterium]
MRTIQNFSHDFGGKKLSVEFGKLAPQADAAVRVQYGETTILATVMGAKDKRDETIDFLPLTVDYEERFYAAGKISGSRFIKREGRPSEEATLTSRLIDRPIRPLFPEGYFCDVQVMITVLSYDHENSPRIPALFGTSLALSLSSIPWNGPVSIAEVGLIDGSLVLNPTEEQMKKSEMDLTVVSTSERVIMIEAGAKQVPQEKVLEAITFAHSANQEIIAFQQKIITAHGALKRTFTNSFDEALYNEVAEKSNAFFASLSSITEKLERRAKTDEFIAELTAHYKEDAVKAKRAHQYFDLVEKKYVRSQIIQNSKRVDGRGINDVRPISSEVTIVPRVHGSALFNRGYTQIFNVTTLGAPGLKQMLDTMMENDSTKRYMHHYNFPPYSTGETKGLRSPGRREIGHGALAEKALVPVLPSEEEFPYAIRLVSEAMSSDGSTSMGSTCASTLSLMDAGVPLKAPVSGIAMGLIDEGDKYVVLTDIAGHEDHHGDMDFKITGTTNGITAIQLDVKNTGLTMPMIKETFEKGLTGRLHILQEMLKTIATPRAELSPYAPRVEVVMINPEKIRDVIGPGGKMINKIIAETGAQIDIEQDGRVIISSPDKTSIEKAKEMIAGLTEEPEVGRIYPATVVKIMDFGAFVAIPSGQEGLVHVSEIDSKRVEKVSDYLQEGQAVRVKLMAIDDLGRLNFSIKQAAENN